METGVVQKNSSHKIDIAPWNMDLCEELTGQKFSPAQVDNSIAYETIPKSRLCTQNPSCYERLKTALRGARFFTSGH